MYLPTEALFILFLWLLPLDFIFMSYLRRVVHILCIWMDETAIFVCSAKVKTFEGKEWKEHACQLKRVFFTNYSKKILEQAIILTDKIGVYFLTWLATTPINASRCPWGWGRMSNFFFICCLGAKHSKIYDLSICSQILF